VKTGRVQRREMEDHPAQLASAGQICCSNPGTETVRLKLPPGQPNYDFVDNY